MTRRRRSSTALALLALLASAPSALAAPGALDLASDAPLALDGRLVATLERGLATMEPGVRTFDASLSGLEGKVTLYTWQETATDLATFVEAEPERVEHSVSGATLAWSLRAEDGNFRLAATDGTLAVAGDVTDEGRPERFGRVAVREVEGPWPLPKRPPVVPIQWEPEWQALGTHAADHVAMQPFPQVGNATLDARGEVTFVAWGGNVTFRDAAGNVRDARLGTWTSESPTYPATPAARQVTYSILRFDGTLSGARIPLAGGWGVAGPAMDARLDGTAAWRDATGEARVGGQRETFQHANVTLDLDGAVLPTLPSLGPAAQYGAEGDFRALRVDGATVRPAAAPIPLAAPAAVGLGALLLLLLTKTGQSLLAMGAASLYTRLAPGDVLLHPQRRRMNDLVSAEPGIHQRELHRRVGGAWGPFTFHLRMLAKAGHVRVVRQGGYALVFPAGAPPTASAIPHPVARAVYDALPQDGAPLALVDVVARVGVSRELVGYHLRGLEARGLVKRVPLEGGRKGVARVPTEATSAGA